MSAIKPKSLMIIFLAFIATALLAQQLFYFMFYTSYLTHIQESVSGLKIGSPIEFNGVEVGYVTQIHINKTNAKLIDVQLRVARDTPVSQGTVAMFAAGNGDHEKPFIALKDEGNSSATIMATPETRYGVIPSVASLKENANVSLTQIARNMQQFNETFQTFMSKDDIESFRQLIYSLQTVMSMLSENSKRLNHIIINTEKASRNFDSVLGTTQKTMQILQIQTLPATNRLLSNAEELLDRADNIMSEVKQNPAVLIRGKSLPPPGPDEGR